MAFEYLLTTLPPIDDQALSVPDISPSVLWEKLNAEEGRVREASLLLLLHFDVLFLEDLYRGIDLHSPAVYSKDVLKNVEGLPMWLEESLDEAKEDKEGYPFELVWDSYYKRLINLADELEDSFFSEWVEFDHKLRSEIQIIREGGGDVGDDDFFKLDKIIFEKRFEWLKMESPSYTFNSNEVIGYVIRYVILQQGRYLL